MTICGIGSVKAQIADPVKWSFVTNRLNDTIAELKFIANIDAGWHLYSQNLSKNGPLPLEFIFTEINGAILQGKVVESESTEEYDPMFELKVKFFTGKAVFKQKIRITSSGPVSFKGTISYQSCDNRSCIPGDAVFSFSIQGGSGL